MSRSKNGRQSVTQRLTSRNSGLRKKAMPGGGHAYQGDLASKALKATSARAFTMDGDVFVNDDFDASKPEDAALWAHEQYGHAAEGKSGGKDSGDHNHGNDPEEMAAQAVERMVLHRTRGGEDVGEVFADIKGNIPRNAGEGYDQIAKAMHADHEGEDKDQALMGYYGLRSQGMQHYQIVRMLGEAVNRRKQENKSQSDGRGQKT